VTLGELFGQLFGWLGHFVEWICGWCPVYIIVQWNERGVKYPRGKKPLELKAGVHWYIPNLSEVVRHHVSRCVLDVADLSLETADGVPVQVGMVLTYHITDVLKYEVENFEPDENMAEVAAAGLRNIVMEHTWPELTQAADAGSRLESKLARRMDKALERFGVEVETCRPTDQVRLRCALRLFGAHQSLSIGAG
jgi:regulator of protease activity HflC (stomatin/prohibitin superfamily)